MSNDGKSDDSYHRDCLATYCAKDSKNAAGGPVYFLLKLGLTDVDGDVACSFDTFLRIVNLLLTHKALTFEGELITRDIEFLIFAIPTGHDIAEGE